ncbi:MAG TPA: SUMF1/EgtB/PvdO family nonheme iron enzyme [Acidimicrobiales bacterium]|nr:SUMF1/EgtB/PvdO family nonheme iron enzyme [Acidimicrobiales bacterium]
MKEPRAEDRRDPGDLGDRGDLGDLGDRRDLVDWGDLGNPPALVASRAAWRERLEQWRRDARQAVGHDPARYDRPELAWARRCFTCGMVMLWDEDLRQPGGNGLSMARILRCSQSRFGGFDAVVLWHAYPRLGFDDRNQFDFYRQLPGGPGTLRRLVEECHRAGTKAFLAYYPWDSGTRRPPEGEVAALAATLSSSGADGIFLDTMSKASDDLRGCLVAGGPGAVLMTEDFVPLAQVRDHLMSWAQWPPETPAPYVLRNKWFEPRHMQLLVRRWHLDHTNELHLAWLNGAGVVVWENVFGSYNAWSERDASLLRRMRPVHKVLGDVLSLGRWEPMVATMHDGLAASHWEHEGLHLWALANTSNRDLAGPLVQVNLAQGADLWWDLVGGRAVKAGTSPTGAVIEGQVPGGGIAAFAAGGGRHEGLVARVLGSVRPAPVPVAPPRPPPPPPGGAHGRPGERAGAPGDGPRSLTVRYRLRECGMDGPAPLANSVLPHLHTVVTEQRRLTVAACEVDPRPVTNADFQAFLASTGYRPHCSDNFLRHWAEQMSPYPDDAAGPVVFVDYDDAWSYCRWVGKRLPTAEDWQVAMEEGRAGHGSGRVWEWTAPEFSDGHTRYCVLKGGSDYQALGSDWYADGGPRAPDWRAKFVRSWPALDRCATVGFRGARDIVSSPAAPVATGRGQGHGADV